MAWGDDGGGGVGDEAGPCQVMSSSDVSMLSKCTTMCGNGDDGGR